MGGDIGRYSIFGIVITTPVTSACLLSCVEVVSITVDRTVSIVVGLLLKTVIHRLDSITMIGKQAVSEVAHEAPYTNEIHSAI
jgi:hypothetical protein